MFFHNIKDNYKITVRISNEIEVSATSAWLIDEWDLSSSFFFSYLRKGNRIRTKAKYQKHYYFKYYIPKLTAGTIAMIQNIPVLYTGIYDFSTIFHHFVKRMILAGCPFDQTTKFMHDYYSIFILPKNKDVHNFESFKKRVNGYLLLNVEKCSKRRRLTKITHEDAEHYIVNGIFISNYAKSILLNDNKVTGLLLDTTWHVMSNYVTSILMASIGNSGIPLSFAFGPGETKSLYYLHFNTFRDILGIDLTTYTIESDQGSAIEAVCTENNINHIYCLRHFLASLKYNEFSYSVGLLLKFVSDKDFNQAKLTLTNEFKYITDLNKLKKLNKVLNKVRLKFSNKRR